MIRRNFFSLAALMALPSAAVAAPKAASPILSSEFIDDAPPYPECHASTIVVTRGGTLAAAWFGGTKERNPDVEIWFTRLDNSYRSGRWQKPVSVANGIQPDGKPRLPTWNPVLFQDPAGDLFLFYKVGPSPSEWWGELITSSDDGYTWSKPRRLPDGILGPIKNKPVILKDGSWLSPSSTEGGEGVGPNQNAKWQVHFEHSTDRGATWTRTTNVPTPVGIEAIQPSILFHKDGSLEAICRTRQGALAQTWSKDNGATWSGLAAIDLPNPNSGTDAVTLADGRQLLVYNHAAHRPDQPGKGNRYPLNIAVSDDGVAWRPVLTLESTPVGNGYAYPAVIQAPNGLVHITYTWDRKRIKHLVVDPKLLT
jgi:predicted neuraminidase